MTERGEKKTEQKQQLSHINSMHSIWRTKLSNCLLTIKRLFLHIKSAVTPKWEYMKRNFGNKIINYILNDKLEIVI